jgi:MinD superfamily P-loop ATPase
VSLFEPEPYRQITEYLQSLGHQLMVVVNRSSVLPETIRQFCHVHGLPIAGCIPYDTAIPREAVRGKLIQRDELFQNILRNLLSHDGIQNKLGA